MSNAPSARIFVLASLLGTHVEIKDEDFVQAWDITTKVVETL
jgi:hypothetical protein